MKPTKKIKNTSTDIIDPNTIITYKEGKILAGKINRHIRSVLCPKHKDSNPSEFADINEKGIPFISCKKCGTLWVNLEGYQPKSESLFEILSYKHRNLESTVERPRSQDETHQLLHKIRENFSLNNVVYGVEGVGKSYLAKILCDTGIKLIFACHSNKQAEEKFNELNKSGLKPFLLKSKSYEIEKNFGIKPIVHPRKNPWDLGQINMEATINLINKVNPNITESDLSTISSEQPSHTHPVDWTSQNLVVMTHARLQRLGYLNMREHTQGYTLPIPENIVIFYDDPILDDFMTLFTFHSNIRDRKIDGISVDVHIPKKDDRIYYIKPEFLRFGYGLEKNLSIITTTELLIVELISRQRPEITIHDQLFPSTSKLEGGDIHLISTRLVWAKFDGILPLIMERLTRLGFEFEYIANGQGCSTNLCNNKGLNSLSELATVIEISIPTPEETMRLYEQFDGEIEERVINLALMLDKLHQAVGRNSGYRFRGKPCVVLVDPKYFRAIERHSRYSFKSAISPDKENPKIYPRKQPKFDHLAEAIRWYINRLDIYLGDGRKAEYDCIASLRKVNGQQHDIRKKRITISLKNLVKRYPHREKPLNRLLEKLQDPKVNRQAA
ncbi:hypothetical protein [Microbulbifer variabilis]|uniref:hypothetical protein n=1 Tax=Microbulbifer variabilis TaxID=266805 RepID=UPI001CFCCC64|nr:hypothetical protein [Microbulbifer variabilis]